MKRYLFVATVLLALAAVAGAEEPGKLPPDTDGAAPAAVAAPPPDVVLSALRGRRVTIELVDGRRADGELTGWDAESVVLVQPNGAVLAVPRGQVARLLVADRTAPPQLTVAPPPPVAAAAPDVDRHIGLHLGFGPAIAAVDVDYRPFYGFLSGSLGLPIFSDGKIGALTLAAGGTTRVSRTSAWQFDFFAHATAAWFNKTVCTVDTGSGVCGDSVKPLFALGVGAGFHYTFARGFTVGFKVPVLGIAFGEPVRNAGDRGAYYYLGAAMSFPVVSFGYRF